MLPEIQTYFDACEEARKVYRQSGQKVNEENPIPRYRYNESQEEQQARYDAENRNYAAQRTSENELDLARSVARDALGKSEDKTIAFLANVALKEHPDQTELVLRLLPLSREALEAVGPDNDWCPEFGRLYALAEERGALPPYENPANDLDIAALVNDLRYHNGGRVMELRKILIKHLPDIITSYINARVDPLIEGLYKYEFDTAEQFREVIAEHLLPIATVPETTTTESDNCSCSECG